VLRSNGINENILSSRDIQMVTMFLEVMAIIVAVIIIIININLTWINLFIKILDRPVK